MYLFHVGRFDNQVASVASPVRDHGVLHPVVTVVLTFTCVCLSHGVLQGNMGGGFTHFLMPLVFDGIKATGSPAFQVGTCSFVLCACIPTTGGLRLDCMIASLRLHLMFDPCLLRRLLPCSVWTLMPIPDTSLTAYDCPSRPGAGPSLYQPHSRCC
jgi:hypothetical protein